MIDFNNVPEVDLFSEIPQEVKDRINDITDSFLRGDITEDEMDRLIEEI